MSTQNVNRVLLIGTVTDRGVELLTLPSGQPLATFSLMLEEASKTGDIYKTFVPCELFGKGADAAAEVDPGTTVLFEGRLRWKKGEDGKDGKIIVAGWELKPLTPAVTAAARNN